MQDLKVAIQAQKELNRLLALHSPKKATAEPAEPDEPRGKSGLDKIIAGRLRRA